MQKVTAKKLGTIGANGSDLVVWLGTNGKALTTRSQRISSLPVAMNTLRTLIVNPTGKVIFLIVRLTI